MQDREWGRLVGVFVVGFVQLVIGFARLLWFGLLDVWWWQRATGVWVCGAVANGIVICVGTVVLIRYCRLRGVSFPSRWRWQMWDAGCKESSVYLSSAAGLLTVPVVYAFFPWHISVVTTVVPQSTTQ